MATSVKFVNDTAAAVKVYWIDYSGNLVLYQTLPSGFEYVQQTYVTHPWVVQSSAGACLAIFQPLAGEHTALLCGIPDGEATLAHGWADYTLYDFEQILLPATANFKGRAVTEQDPGGDGPDTCWFQGSAIGKQEAISGGSWKVKADNKWGYDTVGWSDKAVSYYRDKGRAPCQTTFRQRMVISCGTTTRPYLTDTLQSGFTKTEVWDERAGVKRSKKFE